MKNVSKLKLAAPPVKHAKTTPLAEVQRSASIFDRYFAVDQQVQINRLLSGWSWDARTLYPMSMSCSARSWMSFRSFVWLSSSALSASTSTR